MSDFNIVKSEFFDDLKCDVYQGEEEYYMTREQIGNALGYANPRVAISNIHARNRDRFDGMSVVLKLSTTDGKSYDTVVYSRKGIMEICRWSRQPKADAFIDQVWDVIDSLFNERLIRIQNEANVQYMIAQSRLMNSNVKQARVFMDLADRYSGSEHSLILNSYAAKSLVGEHTIPLPDLPERTYSATEIGKMLGVTANRIGRLANEYGLKTDEYGKFFKDISASNPRKEVETFRYFQCAIPVLKKLVGDIPCIEFTQETLDLFD